MKPPFAELDVLSLILDHKRMSSFAVGSKEMQEDMIALLEAKGWQTWGVRVIGNPSTALSRYNTIGTIDMMILMGHIYLDPSEVVAFIADTRDFVANTQKFEGCLFYSTALVEQATGRVLTVERWKTQDALTSQTQRPEMAEVIGKWMSRMKIDIQKFDASNERVLTS